MKIPNRQELQQIAINHLSDIDFVESKRFYRKCTAEPYLFLVINITLPSSNPLHVRKNLLKSV